MTYIKSPSRISSGPRSYSASAIRPSNSSPFLQFLTKAFVSSSLNLSTNRPKHSMISATNALVNFRSMISSSRAYKICSLSIGRYNRSVSSASPATEQLNFIAYPYLFLNNCSSTLLIGDRWLDPSTLFNSGSSRKAADKVLQIPSISSVKTLIDVSKLEQSTKFQYLSVSVLLSSEVFLLILSCKFPQICNARSVECSVSSRSTALEGFILRQSSSNRSSSSCFCLLIQYRPLGFQYPTFKSRQVMYFEKNSHYGKQAFWEKRYAENCTEFDWYQNWANLRDIVSQYIRRDSKILNVGAGNSPFSEDMYADGYHNITNIDFSEIVVEDMQLKYRNAGYDPSFKFLHADARNLKALFENETFDCVIDKGMLDSILCGSYSKQNSKKMLREISRVLKNKGVYICVSYGDPDIRSHYFQDKSEKYDWGKKNPWPYKVFKPTIDQSQKEVVFNDKDKDKNKDYYHYVYILGKGEEGHLGQIQGQSKSSYAMINSSTVVMK